MYEADLLTSTCMCLNFPCIKLCKHIAMAMHFFEGGLEGGELRLLAPINASTSELEPDVPKSSVQQDGSVINSKMCIFFNSIVNDIFWLAHSILEMMLTDSDPEMVKSLKMARSQLNAMQCNMNDNGYWLPEKKQIALNQLSWLPTAAHMDVKQGEKCHGKVDSALMMEHIGMLK